MKLSEFWSAVDHVFGSTLGRSMVSDLYLPQLRKSAAEALNDGTDPDFVWELLIAETNTDSEARWIHRIDPKERR